MEERHGFIRDILDVKVLILYVMALVKTPVTSDTIYALCYQDECLSYFDVMEALPQLVESGHLETHNGRYIITEKGRQQGAFTADSIAYPVLERAERAAIEYNEQIRQSGGINIEVTEHGPGEFTAGMTITDGSYTLMRLELPAPNRAQAEALAAAFRNHSDRIYSGIFHTVLQELDPNA